VNDVVTSFKCSPASDSTFPIGKTTVTCTAVDGHENKSTATFTVNVRLTGTVPTVVTGAASSVTTTSATLNATVNPNGAEVTKCEFEYGETTAYGKTASCTSLPGSGTSAVAVSASITGLTANITYHFRISATNVGGTNEGADATFGTVLAHWYKNATKAKEGKPLHELAWGVLKLENTTLGTVECHTVIGGLAENPTGGGAGNGKIQAFSPYECVSETCKSKGGTIEVTTEKLPWTTELVGEAGPPVVFRNRAIGMNLVESCTAVGSVLFHGQSAPKVLNNGIAIGSGPGEEEFDAAAGELESSDGAGKLGGFLKVEGFNSEELVEVKSP